MTYFDPMQGWTSPEEEYIGDTGADLKTVIASIADPTNETFVQVDQLLYDYFNIVRHGETTHLTKKVEWILNDTATGKITVSYKDSAEWFDDVYTDELPKWLLISILRTIQRHKPLGDQKADETIAWVNDLEARYVQRPRYEYAQHLGMEDDDDY
jgi:hypothetical protein